MKAAGYFRVSSEEQVEGWSLDAQRAAFTDFCRTRGWDIVAVYPEEGKSAWKDTISKRPMFKKMLDDARAKKFDVLVTHTLDRFSRNLGVMLESFKVLAESSVTYVSIQEQIDYTKPEGRLFLMMLGAFAQYYSDALSGHTKKGLRQRAASGLHNGEPPFGYERCGAGCEGKQDHASCHILEDKGQAVRELFVKYAGGNVSLSDLARWLNGQGFKTNNRKTVKNGVVTTEGPQLFTAYSVRWILHNKFYAGMISYEDKEYVGQHPALVDRKLFDDVQDKLTKNRSRTQGRSLAKREYLLQGLARCWHCGFTMWADSGGRARLTRYRERPGLAQTGCKFAGKSVLGDVVDTQMSAVFSNLSLLPEWKEFVIQRLGKSATHAEILAERSTLNNRLRRASELYIEGDISKADYDRRKREITTRLDLLVVPEYDAALTAGAMLEDLKVVWSAADTRRKNRMLTAMLEAVYLDTEGEKVAGFLPKPAFKDLFLCMSGNGVVKVFEPSPVPTCAANLPELVGQVETGES